MKIIIGENQNRFVISRKVFYSSYCSFINPFSLFGILYFPFDQCIHLSHAFLLFSIHHSPL